MSGWIGDDHGRIDAEYMCTLIAIHRHVPGRSLVVAANRDEYFDRPSEGPALRIGAGGAIVTPLDVRAGGTWLGLNGSGVFAALTNLRNETPDPTRRSRGDVVMEALEAQSAERAAAAIGASDEKAYNPFNCYVADADSAWVIVYRDRPILQRLEPGVHVIGNADANAATSPKLERIHREASAAAELPPEEVLRGLERLCQRHGTGDDPLTDTCVHAGDTYGTRSSILIEMYESGGQDRLLYADGPPCTHPYADFSSLLHELRRTPGYGAVEKPTRTAS